MHYDPLRLGPCPKDLSEWTSLPPPPQYTPHTTTAQQLVPHTRIRVPFPPPRHNIRPAQQPAEPTTTTLSEPTLVLLSAFPLRPQLFNKTAVVSKQHRDIRPPQGGTSAFPHRPPLFGTSGHPAPRWVPFSTRSLLWAPSSLAVCGCLALAPQHGISV